MADPLLQYIVSQEQAGHSDAQIRAVLAAQGYSQQQIEAAFRQLQGSQADAVIHEYVQQYARQGSTPAQVFKALTEQGYAPGKVRKAIVEVFGPGTMKTHHTVFLVVALLVVAVGIYLINPSGIFSPAAEPPTFTGGPLEFKVGDEIDAILHIARTQGKDTALSECQSRLRDLNRDYCILDVAIEPKVADSQLCDQIADISMRDTCLVNFISDPKANACKRMRLKENIDTCNSVSALQGAAGT